MGFDIRTNRDASFRSTLSERDLNYLANCNSCPVAEGCGGWSRASDARWCEGPGDVCFDSCRALCSRSPEKVDRYARMLGEGNYGLRANPWSSTGEYAYPDFRVAGKHAWKAWEFSGGYPVVGYQLNSHVEFAHRPLYVVPLKQLYYGRRGQWAHEQDLRVRYKIPESSLLAVTMTSRDVLLDQLQEDMDEMAERLAWYRGVDFFFAPNFSIYDNYPRLDQLYRQKSKFVALELMQRHGLKVVPDLCVATRKDFDNLSGWMVENKCPMGLVNFQVQASTTETDRWKNEIQWVNALSAKIGGLHLFAYGAVGGDRVQSLHANYKHSITYIDAKSYRLAEYKKGIDEKPVEGLETLQLFQKNCNDRENMIAQIRGRRPDSETYSVKWV